VIACLHSFRGESQQIPPAFSALKVKGKRAYELARAGKTFELKARTVHVHHLEVETTEIPEISFVCKVSKGTYIRSLIRDVGELLGCGAHMTGLRRLNVGEFSIQDSLSLDELQDAPEEGRKRIISMNEVLHRLPELELEEDELQRLQHGCVSHSMSRLEPKGDGAHRVSDQEGNLLALLRSSEEEWKIIRVFPLD
jgi:tRNA pseudouridine55 synthase